MSEQSVQATEFQIVLSNELLKLSVGLRSFIQAKLVSPHAVELCWEYGKDEPFLAWTCADMKERDVVAQYCSGGFGQLGSPWGINFSHAKHFGMDCGWYASLAELITDWGVS